MMLWFVKWDIGKVKVESFALPAEYKSGYITYECTNWIALIFCSLFPTASGNLNIIVVALLKERIIRQLKVNYKILFRLSNEIIFKIVIADDGDNIVFYLFHDTLPNWWYYHWSTKVMPLKRWLHIFLLSMAINWYSCGMNVNGWVWCPRFEMVDLQQQQSSSFPVDMSAVMGSFHYWLPPISVLLGVPWCSTKINEFVL